MKFSFMLAGIGLCVFALMLLKARLRDKEVLENGLLIEMLITEMPSCKYRKKMRPSVSLFYAKDKKWFSKKVKRRFCSEYRYGDYVQVKYLPGKSSVMFPDESLKSEFISLGLLFVFGCFCVGFDFCNTKSKTKKRAKNRNKYFSFK